MTMYDPALLRGNGSLKVFRALKIFLYNLKLYQGLSNKISFYSFAFLGSTQFNIVNGQNELIWRYHRHIYQPLYYTCFNSHLFANMTNINSSGNAVEI